MADIAHHTLELLRKLREDVTARFNKVDLSLRDLTEQARIVNAHVAALVQHENFATTKFSELEARVERIEKRLDLSDPRVRKIDVSPPSNSGPPLSQLKLPPSTPTTPRRRRRRPRLSRQRSADREKQDVAWRKVPDSLDKPAVLATVRHPQQHDGRERHRVLVPGI